MYIYKSLQADCLNIYFIHHCSTRAAFLPNSRDAVENGCSIPYLSYAHSRMWLYDLMYVLAESQSCELN